jgi:hypothetical protein
MRKFGKFRFYSLFLVFAWLLSTTGVVLLSLAGYHYLSNPQKTLFAQARQDQNGGVENTANGLDEPKVQGVETVVQSDDARPVIVAEFLERHNSPMTPYDYYGQRLVEIADTYNLDFRLLPAIAMRESNLCKNTHSDAPHNCLGFGIHSEGTLDFDSYEAGFERAAREIRAYYVDGGRITTEQVGAKYASSPTWADGVNQFMAEMRYDDRALGLELKQDDTSVTEFAQ